MKDSYLHIVPECYVDTNLVQILMQIKGVNHQNSCGQVTLTEFGIPDDLEGLKNVTKSKNCLDNNDLRRAIKAVSSSNEMQLLTDVLNYLLQKTVDIPVLGGWISTVFCNYMCFCIIFGNIFGIICI